MTQDRKIFWLIELSSHKPDFGGCYDMGWPEIADPEAFWRVPFGDLQLTRPLSTCEKPFREAFGGWSLFPYGAKEG
jgi:hypothetical protein